MKVNKKFLSLFLLLFLFIPFYFACAEEIYDTFDTNGVDIEELYYKNENTNYTAFIDDRALLLTDEEEKKLMNDMIPLTEYGHIAFVSIDENDYSTSSYANTYYHEHFNQDSGSIFLIDMDNREIYIFSDGYNYKTITSSKAYSITDNIYTYASDEDYYTCASLAFSQMKALLSGGKILEPMRYTSNVFLALVISFFFSFIFVLSHSKIKKASDKSIIKNCDISFTIGKTFAEKTGSHRVYSPPSDSSSGGGSSGGGGGGGGSSGGGGGHSF